MFPWSKRTRSEDPTGGLLFFLGSEHAAAQCIYAQSHTPLPYFRCGHYKILRNHLTCLLALDLLSFFGGSLDPRAC